MIKPVTMYTVFCDCCGKDAFQGWGTIAWNEPDFALDVALESGWETEHGKHYCENCQQWTEEGDRVYKKKNKEL